MHSLRFVGQWNPSISRRNFPSDFSERISGARSPPRSPSESEIVFKWAKRHDSNPIKSNVSQKWNLNLPLTHFSKAKNADSEHFTFPCTHFDGWRGISDFATADAWRTPTCDFSNNEIEVEDGESLVPIGDKRHYVRQQCDRAAFRWSKRVAALFCCFVRFNINHFRWIISTTIGQMNVEMPERWRAKQPSESH